jgi:DNA-binding NtrC family response regulator
MQKKRILLVEDDRSLQTALRYFLEDMGYEIVVAENHAQATQVIGQGPFAAAIVDYFLGNIPTSHLIAELQQRHPSMPLVCSTAASIGQIQIAEGAAPPTAYLFKPFDVSELRDTCQQVLPTGTPAAARMWPVTLEVELSIATRSTAKRRREEEAIVALWRRRAPPDWRSRSSEPLSIQVLQATGPASDVCR